MAVDNVDKEYLGQLLLQQGFGTWMRYMFRLINGVPFITEPLHLELFNQIQNVIDGVDTRININLPPRTGKTTINIWLVVYALTVNPRSQIIYTSFNQDLLTGISTQVAAIMQSPQYRVMYGNRQSVTESAEDFDPLDEYWRDWLRETAHREKFSSRKITTSAGGVVLFNAIGAAITGFGAGVRGAYGFSGMIVIDDGDKPADIFSETKRNKTHDYYSGTILTRLNNPDTPIVNTQQRLHTEDLTGYLENIYGFKTFKFPLLADDGTCTLPRQYTPERIAELQKDAFVFASQYQQVPTIRGGNLIKTEWFNHYVVPPTQFDSLFIVADTAFSEKQSADYSAFGLFGTVGEKMYMLGGYVKRVIFPDLCRDLTAFYKDAVATYRQNTVSAVYIENKGSGISLIQQLRQHGLPISELSPTVHNAELKKDQISDKYTRLMEVISDIESGYFYLPEQAHWLNEFLTECEAFTGGKQDVHDDFCFVANTKIKCMFGDKNIQDIRVGDKVITPFGIRKVLAVNARETDVVANQELGLCGTPDHKVLSHTSGLVPLCKAKKQDCMQWSWRNLSIWKIRKALSSMAQNTAGWAERESISYLMQRQTRQESIRKACTLRSGNIITTKKFRKAMRFITKTVTHTTVALIIWCVYHTANTCKSIWSRVVHSTDGQNNYNICKIYGKKQPSGTSQKRATIGINNKPNVAWNALQRLKSVQIVDANTKYTTSKSKQMSLTGVGVKSATKNTGNGFTESCNTEKSTVYNLTVNGGLYFANNTLVSNCDVLIYALKVRRKLQSTDWTEFTKNFIGY